MNESAKSRILFALRDALKPAKAAVDVPDALPQPELTGKEKIDRLKQHLELVKSEVHLAGKKEWLTVLAEIMKQKRISNFLLSTETAIGRKIADHAFRADQDFPELLPVTDHQEGFKDLLFEVDAAITTSKGGIAETGAVILWPDQKEPRLMSLIPPIHIVILEADNIYDSFTRAMAEGNWAQQMPTNAVLISGPSKTADIEMVLTYGVHGPKEFIVIILE